MTAAATTGDAKRTEDVLCASEARWKTLLENATVGIAITDMEGHFEITNGVYQKLLGYSEEEMRRITFLDVTAPEFREQNLKLLGECLEGKRQQFDIEKQYKRKDGTLVWVRNNVLLVPGSDGKPRHIMAIVDNISARKCAEESLRASEERWRVILEAASDVVLGADETGIIRYANPATRRVFGFEPNELIGRPLTVLMPQSLRERHERAFRRYQSTGLRQLNWSGTELTGLRKSGEEFPVEVSFGELGAGGHRVFTGFIRDITERKRAEEERRKTAEALVMAQERLARAAQGAILGELAASIAHEINQPLAAVVANGHACVSWLSASPANLERARGTAENIVRDGKAAAEFVQRIRGLFRHATPARDWLDIEGVLAEVIGVMGDEIAGRGGQVKTEFAAKLPPVVGDRIQIQQVVINLIRNALDAMDDVDPQARIVEIRARRESPESVALEVLDGGCGIEDTERIFMPFFTTKRAGMGVGLSICRSIVAAHGGRLRAVSNGKRGSRFIVSLPAQNMPRG